MRASLWAGLAATVLTFGLEWSVIQSVAKISNALGVLYFSMWILAIVVAGNVGLAVSYCVEEKASGRKATIDGFLRTIA